MAGASSAPSFASAEVGIASRTAQSPTSRRTGSFGVTHGLRRVLPFLIFAQVVAAVSAAVMLQPGDGTATRHTKPAPGSYSIGVNLPDVPDVRSGLEAWCRLVGIRPAVVMWFQSWSEPIIYQPQARTIRATRVTPMVTWDPVTRAGHQVSMSAIASGRYDRYIKNSARRLRNLHTTVLLRFAHEMNLATSPFGPGHVGDDPAEYVAAWRHVVRTFRAVGARHVEFVWSPNVDCQGACPFKPYFPGQRWIDWAALDGYNYGTAHAGTWRSMKAVFADSYRQLSHLTAKPLMIAETASAGSGGSKAAWISTGLRRTVPTDFPRIRLVVWFNRQKGRDWQVDSSTASLRAFRAAVHSSTINGARVTYGCSA